MMKNRLESYENELKSSLKEFDIVIKRIIHCKHCGLSQSIFRFTCSNCGKKMPTMKKIGKHYKKLTVAPFKILKKMMPLDRQIALKWMEKIFKTTMEFFDESIF